ncbi:RNA polymerase sigma-70 factor (ECF subfamily) [Actinoalloteichus hymeniacidonis]|nr:RNA polymerase sigma-70 factor (ECF subfamily) [Actinoalloteichus hymeniacidonis]
MSRVDDELALIFEQHRAHLTSVAYRLHGTRTDAEDAVQESWLRLISLDGPARAAIDDHRAWLTTVVGRICLDRMRSAVARRERYVGPWLPEPLVARPIGSTPAPDPLDQVVQADGMRTAALLVLQRLSPDQRVAFVLHDGFAVPFPEIAEVLGCSAAAARQHASRARRVMVAADPPPRVAPAEQQRLLTEFLAALAARDTEALTRVLHPEVAMHGDGGGKAKTTLRVVLGAPKVIRFLFGLLDLYGEAMTAGAVGVLVNGDVGVLVGTPPTGAEQAAAVGPARRTERAGTGRRSTEVEPRVAWLAVRDGRIEAIYDLANPDKLARILR